MNKPATPPDREFTVGEGLVYMFGAIGVQLLTVMLAEWSQFYYHPPEGAGRVAFTSLHLASYIMMFGVFMDAVSDPIVGWWSDRARTRLGRRRPFIIGGAPLACVSFVMFWYPPVPHDSIINFIWGTFWVSAFFWGITLVLIPYIALLPELARSTRGRVKLGMYSAMGMIIGLVLGIMSGMLIEEIGAQSTALIFAAISFVSFQVTGWYIKERHKPDDAADVPGTLRELAVDLAGTLKNRPFLIFVVSETIFTLGFFVIQIALPDFNSVILKKSEGFVTYLFVPFLLVCIPLIFVVEPFVKKWNTKRTYLAGIIGFTILFPFFGMVGLLPNPVINIFGLGVELRVLLLLVVVGLAGAPQAIKYVMPGVLIGEIADYDEKTSGRRREAIYSGAMGFGLKMAMMFSYLIRLSVYAPFGKFSIHNTTPVLLIGPVTAVICFIGVLVFLKYPVLQAEKNPHR